MKTIIKIFFIAALITVSNNLFAQTYTWHALGSGLVNGTNDTVKAITSFNGKIIYGGNFSQAGGVNAQNIAAYDPVTNTWSALGSGINGEVKALFVSGSDLIAGGSFTQAGITNANNVAKWNGTNWSAMSSGLNDDVNALIVYSGSIVAGGNFSMPGGNDNVARWNGSNWVSMGNGLTGSGDRVNAFTLFQGNLVAGGRFEESGSTNISNIAKWNGSSWSAFNSNNFDGDVNALVVYNNELYAGGDFNHIGSNDRKYIAKWNGSGWLSVGGGLDDGPVEAFSVFRNTLIVGGNFRVTGTGLFVDRIASWSGSSWSRMLTGHNDHVYALYTRNSTDTILYSGGEYTTAGGKWCYHAAMWGRFDTVSVSGQVRYADNNSIVTGGRIKILRMDVITREIIAIDSANVDAFGNYILTRVPRNDSTLRVMIFPDDELNDGIDTGFVPTYYPSTIEWLSAGVLYAGGNLTNININVIRRNTSSMQDGMAANISGNVFLNILPPMDNSDLLAGPLPYLKGSILYLKKDTSFVKSVISDDDQHYSIIGVTAGTYTLTVQRLGYETEARQIVIGTANLDTVNFYLDTLNVIGIVNINTGVPGNFSLEQNYPNPFNPQTRIKFSITGSTFAELKIFDILGREVKTLVNENLRAGEYEVTFSAVNLPSGVYFYRLKTTEFTETKKMVLIK
ncbi:MAG TPA: T9SS type A sorting domain-containing protein [Ignavibacteria bacterium]|nr:T9SS type A sorting domain-containing protein [Ignavibacteria bacterium]HMQ98334.1 T9SS type A sorting domain-containing protein [Ignavibacteria bacterium]